MVALNNINFNTLINETLSSNSNQGLNGSNLINSIYSIYFDKTNNQNTSAQNKSDSIRTIVEGVANFVLKVLNVFANANADIEGSNNKIKEGEKAAENETVELEKNLKNIINDITKNTKSIEDAIKTLNKFGKNSEKKEKELEKQKQIVDENLKIIKDSTSDENARKNAINNLLVASKNIEQLATEIVNYSKEIEANMKQVDDLTAKIDEFSNNAVELIKNGVKDIEQISVKTGAEGVKNTQFAPQGAREVSEGTALCNEGAAATAGTLGVGAAAGAELIKQGTEYINAGTTHIQGSAKNLADLGVALGKMGSNMKKVSDYTNSIGSLADNATQIIGTFGTTADSMIKAVGSWETVANGAKDLGTAIENYNKQESNVESDNQSTNDENKNDQTNLFTFNTSVFELKKDIKVNA